MLNNCMVDIETLGTRPGSVILSIGAVMFDPVSGELGAQYYRNIRRDSCEEAGLTVDLKTLQWWEGRSLEARAALASEQACIGRAIIEFKDWWIANSAEIFWSHGANFDEVLLQSAFRAVDEAVPWSYWNVMCCRTLHSLTQIKLDRSKGVHHNALDDAMAQARSVHMTYRALGR